MIACRAATPLALLCAGMLLDNAAALPALDHPIMEAALRDLTMFRTDTAARVAQFHGALRGIKALGVQHCGVRFRSRSADELIEQIEAFGHDVAPLING